MSFLMELLGFHKDRIVLLANRDTLISFLPVFIPFISFSYFISSSEVLSIVIVQEWRS